MPGQDYPPQCDIANGHIIDIRHSIPENSPTETYEIYEQPHGETNLCLHTRKYIADSYASAMSALDKIRAKSLHKDTFMAVSALKKNPDLILNGTIYPARYYIRRPAEAVYKIIRMWRGYDEDTSTWIDKTSSETHYNYSVAVAELVRTREYIVKHRLRIQAELKLVAGVIYPHELDEPFEDNPNHNPNRAFIDMPHMTRRTFDAICVETRRLGIDAIINNELGTILLPRNVSQADAEALTLFVERIIRANIERDALPPRAQQLIDEIRARGLPVAITHNGEHMTFNVSGSATRDQRNQINALTTAYRNETERLSRPIPPPTEIINLKPIRHAATIARAHCRLREILAKSPLRIDAVITDTEVRVSNAAPWRIHKYVERMRMLVCMQEGAAQVQRTAEAFEALRDILQTNHGVTLIDNNNNTLSITGTPSEPACKIMALLIREYNRRRADGFVTTREHSTTHPQFEALIAEIRRRRIPIKVTTIDNAGAVEATAEATAEQRAELTSLMREYSRRGNTMVETTWGDMLDEVATPPENTCTCVHTNPPVRQPSVEMPIMQSALNVIHRRVYDIWINVARRSGVSVELRTNADGSTTPVYHAGTSTYQRDLMNAAYESLLRKEMNRIAECERIEIEAIVGALQQHGVPVSMHEYDGVWGLNVSDSATQQQHHLIRSAMEIYKSRRDNGFPPANALNANEMNNLVNGILASRVQPEPTPEQIVQSLTDMFARVSGSSKK